VHATVTVPARSRNTVAGAGGAAAAQVRHVDLSGALRSRDTELMIGALRTLGLRVDGSGSELTVSGASFRAPTPSGLRLGGDGFAIRSPLAALADSAVDSMGTNKLGAAIAPLLDALRGLGVRIEGTGLLSVCTAADRSPAAP